MGEKLTAEELAGRYYVSCSASYRRLRDEIHAAERAAAVEARLDELDKVQAKIQWLHKNIFDGLAIIRLRNKWFKARRRELEGER